MTKIDAVVFDIGNVLIEWQPERYFDRLLSKSERTVFFDEADLHEMMNNVDQGNPIRSEVDKLQAKLPKYHDLLELWATDWLNIAGPEMPVSIKILHHLRNSGIQVFALSNFGRDTFANAKNKWPFLADFDRHYISGHMQVIKPDPQIYKMVEQDCLIPPSQLLFTDDRFDNIQTAKDRGWQTHLFQTPQDWARCLCDHGLILPNELKGFK